MDKPVKYRDFYDGTVLKARITPTHLYTFDRLANGECLLGEITEVNEARIPGTGMAVIGRIPGRERSPAARFTDEAEAARFSEALIWAVESAYMEECSMQKDDTSELLGTPIHVHAREQAIEDGRLVDVTQPAKEAGFAVDTALTAALEADISDLTSPLCHGCESRGGGCRTCCASPG